MKTGETIRNKQTGETLTMLVSEEENGGVRQLHQVHLPPRRPTPPLHYHLKFAETFSVVEGALDIYLDRERRHILLNPQESITAEVRQLHTFANDRDESTLITIDTQPAGEVVKAFQLAYGVANDGRAAKDGLPRNPLVRLIFIRTSEGFLSYVPLAVQKVVFGLAAFVAKMTGIERPCTTERVREPDGWHEGDLRAARSRPSHSLQLTTRCCAKVCVSFPAAERRLCKHRMSTPVKKSGR
jgi:mannose-6-phosphate isomerase-like protein (cupin superfamily)